MNLQETMIQLSLTRHKKILAQDRPRLHWRRTSSFLVRIVAQPSPRYGGEMKPAELSATLVVRLHFLFFFDFRTQLLIASGLYYKLHGVHRPVAMKKSIIKRRKRVVPATQEQESSVHLTAFRVSTSPNSHYSENMDLRHHGQDSPSADLNGSGHHEYRQHMDHQQHHYDPPPIGVDFTGYQIDQPHHAHFPLPGIRDPSVRHPSSPESQRTLSPFIPPASRKRSFSDAQLEKQSSSPSESGRTNRLSSISSILNPTRRQPADDMPIDPSLSGIGQLPPRQSSQLPHIPPQHQQPHSIPPQHQQPHSIPSENRGDHGGWDRRERKARLRREAEQLREVLKANERELKAKERELEELGGEG